MAVWVWCLVGFGGVAAMLLMVYLVVLSASDTGGQQQVATGPGQRAPAPQNAFVPTSERAPIATPPPSGETISTAPAPGAGPTDTSVGVSGISPLAEADKERARALLSGTPQPVAQPREPIADPDADFDPSQVEVPEIPSTNGMLSTDVPAEYLEQAVEVCESFRFLPGTRDQYYWMQWLARRMVSFQDELKNDPFEGTPERQEKLAQAVAHAASVLSEVQFTDRRVAAVNPLAMEAFENSGRRSVIPVFAFARGLPCSTSGPSGPRSGLLLEIEGSDWSFVVFDPPENLSENESDFMLVLGFILTNGSTNAWSQRGENRYYSLRTYHTWEGDILETSRVAAANRPRPSVFDDDDFDPSTVVLDAPQESEGSLTPASELNEALENCLAFRFMPANRNHYAWMQRLVKLMMRFERSLQGQNYRYLTDYQEEILASLENAQNVVASVPFTPERMQAVNRFALEDMHNHEPPSRTEILIYGQVFSDVQLGSNTDILVAGSEEAAVVLAPAGFADEFSADCHYLFMGIIDNNTYGFSHFGTQYNARGMVGPFGFAEEGPTLIRLQGR